MRQWGSVVAALMLVPLGAMGQAAPRVPRPQTWWCEAGGEAASCFQERRSCEASVAGRRWLRCEEAGEAWCFYGQQSERQPVPHCSSSVERCARDRAAFGGRVDGECLRAQSSRDAAANPVWTCTSVGDNAVCFAQAERCEEFRSAGEDRGTPTGPCLGRSSAWCFVYSHAGETESKCLATQSSCMAMRAFYQRRNRVRYEYFGLSRCIEDNGSERTERE